MRKLVIAGLSLLIATAALAQQSKSNAFYVFMTNPGGGYSDHNEHFEGAFGVALQHMFAPRFSGEIAISSDVTYTRVRTFDPDGTVRTSSVLTNRTTPIDLAGRYHFFRDSHWNPYLGADARLVDGRAFFGLNGGLVWQFRPALGLRVDSKVLVSDRPRHNERMYNSIGLSWRF
jgi:hypothetical protein